MSDDRGFHAQMLDERSWKGRQGVHYEAVWQLGRDDRVRVRIKRDHYDFQSHAVAELWRGNWEPIAEIPYPLMNSCERTAGGTSSDPADWEELFRLDEAWLIDRCGLVLYGARR